MRPRHTLRHRGAILATLVCLTTGTAVTAPWSDSPAQAEDDVDEDDGFEAGERYYNLATRYVRFKGYSKALAFFKKALPFMNEEAGIYYNMMGVAEALKKYDEVYFYAAAFLRIEPEGSDSREAMLKMKRAGSTLKAKRRAPAEVTFDVFPKGTSLYVNHVPVGDSGGPPIHFPAGTYTVTGQMDGYHPFERTFTVNPRTPVTVTGAFERVKYYGHLEIQTFEAPCMWPCSALQAAVERDDKSGLGLKEAKGVKVFVNDSLVGETPMDKLKLLADRYLVRFEREGSDVWSRWVRIHRDDTHTLHPVIEQTPLDEPESN